MAINLSEKKCKPTELSLITSLAAAPDGGFIIAGSNADYYSALTKYDTNGNKLFSKSVSGEVIFSYTQKGLAVFNDGTVFSTASSSNNGIMMYQFFDSSLDSVGSVKQLNITEGGLCSFSTVVNNDNDYVLVTSVCSNNSNSELLLSLHLINQNSDIVSSYSSENSKGIWKSDSLYLENNYVVAAEYIDTTLEYGYNYGSGVLMYKFDNNLKLLDQFEVVSLQNSGPYQQLFLNHLPTTLSNNGYALTVGTNTDVSFYYFSSINENTPQLINSTSNMYLGSVCLGPSGWLGITGEGVAIDSSGEHFLNVQTQVYYGLEFAEEAVIQTLSDDFPSILMESAGLVDNSLVVAWDNRYLQVYKPETGCIFTEEEEHHEPIGAIIGGAVGGVAVIGLAALAYYMYSKYNTNQGDESEKLMGAVPGGVVPGGDEV